MAPRAFDRYMVQIGMGTHPKLARLTDSEFRAHIVGVLAVAAMAPVRGRLLVGDLAALPVDIATAAGVPVKVAESAMEKLYAIGVLKADKEHDCLRVHDWEDVNPPPGSSAERMRRHRASHEASQRNGSGDAERVTRASHSVTETSHSPSPEVEVEVKKLKVKDNVSLRSTVSELFAYWQERCNHPQAKLSSDRRSKIETRLREGYTAENVRLAIDGAAVAPFIDERGKRFDDIELICRSGSKLEGFMARASSVQGAQDAEHGRQVDEYLERLAAAQEAAA